MRNISGDDQDGSSVSAGAFLPGPRLRLDPTGGGLLDGLSCGVKDVFDIQGQVTGFGNPTWQATHPPATAHAVAVRALLASGAGITGKTITDELAFSLSGVNHHYGAPLNSAAPDRLTGGSSCGSAAAVAAGLCDVGLGTDTAGSIRAPGSFCGLYGFRPTHGAISLAGVCPLASSFDTVGWLARDMETLCRVGAVLLPGDGDVPMPAAIGWAADAGALLDGEAGARICELIEGLVTKAAVLSPIDLSPAGLDGWFEAFRTLQFAEVWQQLGPWVRQHRPLLGHGVSERLAQASRVSVSDISAAAAVRHAVCRRLDAIWSNCGALVMPTVPDAAPLRASTPEFLERYRRDAMRLLCVAGLGGCPQVTMPGLTSQGAPLGLSLIGPRHSDRRLLGLASGLSRRFSTRGAGFEVR